MSPSGAPSLPVAVIRARRRSMSFRRSCRPSADGARSAHWLSARWSMPISSATLPVRLHGPHTPARTDGQRTRVARILITGASGFIGCELAQFAARAGHEVKAISPLNNDTERARCERLKAAGINVVVASLEDRSILETALAGQDAVIHLAAAQHEAEASETHFRRVNVDGTRNLLGLAVKAGVGRFVHGSTIGVYGSAASGTLDESSALAPANLYGRTKAEAEV